MIGLGSNRLCVCRRGGMSVTQAGRGGMEWLAGDGRRGRSPYSAAATAALKDAYPDLWTTLRDFGFRNPDKVPFINQYPLVAPYLLADGLAFMVDCQYECSAALWKDLIGAVEFAGTNVQIVDDVPYFNGSAEYTTNNFFNIAEHATIEVVMNFGGSTYLALYDFTNGNSTRLCFVNSNRNSANTGYDIFFGGTTSYVVATTSPVKDVLRAFATYDNKLFTDGEELTSYRTSSWGVSNRYVIGNRSAGGSNFIGKLYSIRIYNRLLTEQEILANQAIDLQRWQAS